MHNVETYMKTKHDIANQLQFLDACYSLNQHEKAEIIARGLVSNFRAEQQFLKLNCPKLIQHYINTVLEERLFEWAFEVELLTSAIGNYDDILHHFMEVCIDDFCKRIDTKSKILISIFESNQDITMYMSLTGNIINITKPLKYLSEITDDFVEYQIEIRK